MHPHPCLYTGPRSCSPPGNDHILSLTLIFIGNVGPTAPSREFARNFHEELVFLKEVTFKLTLLLCPKILLAFVMEYKQAMLINRNALRGTELRMTIASFRARWHSG